MQVSMARYAELEEALAQAEQSIEHVVDEQLVRIPRWLSILSVCCSTRAMGADDVMESPETGQSF